MREAETGSRTLQATLHQLDLARHCDHVRHGMQRLTHRDETGQRITKLKPAGGASEPLAAPQPKRVATEGRLMSYDDSQPQ